MDRLHHPGGRNARHPGLASSPYDVGTDGGQLPGHPDSPSRSANLYAALFSHQSHPNPVGMLSSSWLGVVRRATE
jgi:hypothetical protein